MMASHHSSPMPPSNPNKDHTEEVPLHPLEENPAAIPDDELPFFTQLLLPQKGDPTIPGGANKVFPPNVVPISRPRDASGKPSAPRQTPVSGNWGIRSRIGRVLKSDTEK